MAGPRENSQQKMHPQPETLGPPESTLKIPPKNLSGTGDSQRDSRESLATETPIFIARQADSHESLDFPIRANHPIRANRANRFAPVLRIFVVLWCN